MTKRCPKCKMSVAVRSNFCPHCGEKLVKNAISLYEWCYKNDKISLLEEWSINNKLKPSQVSGRTHSDVLWVCKKCNYEWSSSIGNRTNGQGCPACASRGFLPGINDICTKFPEIAKQWHPTKNDTTPDKVAGGSIKKYWWICSLGHEWCTTPNSRTRGRNCPYCANKKTIKGFNDITVTNPELLKDWNDDRDPSNFTFGSDAKINWKCSKCGNIWKSQLKTRAISKYGCPKCSESKGEIKVLEILISNNIVVEKQKRYEKCRYKKPLPFDFYLPTFNILIEYQGIHHYKSHCKNFRHSKRYCDENLDLVAKKDKIKQNFCYRNNIKLIRIPYYRLDKIEDILRKYSIIK